MSLISEEYLEHHGVLGQKWGVRRYQNPDGSLTDKGKKRVAKLNAKVNKIYKKKTKRAEKKVDAWKEANKRTVLSDYKVGGKRVQVYASKKDRKAMVKGLAASNKIDYQRKLRDIRKSEIQRGMNYYEREFANKTGVAYYFGGLPARAFVANRVNKKYSSGVEARTDLRKDYKKGQISNAKNRSYNKYKG